MHKNMENNKLIKVLTEMGLTENEAKVYFACLGLGPSPILKISRASGIKRTTVYSVIEALKQKSLVNIEMKGWKSLLAAESPDRLEQILETKRSKLKTDLPEFLALYNLKESGSFIKYYEGMEAVKSVYTRLSKELRPRDDYMAISNQKQWLALDEKFFMDFKKRVSKLNTNTRLLLQDSDTAREFKKIGINFNEKVKILPSNASLSTNLIITPSKVVIHQLVPPITAMVIENKNIVQMHKEMFEIIWKAIID